MMLQALPHGHREFTLELEEAGLKQTEQQLSGRTAGLISIGTERDVVRQILPVSGDASDAERSGKQLPRQSEDPVGLPLQSMLTIVTIARSERMDERIRQQCHRGIEIRLTSPLGELQTFLVRRVAT